ncbi:glycosyltransferase [Algibacter sp. AS12]|uniref:glycosyltransferase n=1 Tax=Algibacter sp. AS12 TaxID=3135773 RepID=UPI00398B7D0B
MILTLLFVTLIYLILIGSFIIGFNKVSTFILEDLRAKTKFSIVIPFRNEAKHLPELLQSVLALNYPKHLFEIIFVDDDSNDNSVTIIQNTLNSAQTPINSKIHFQLISNTKKSNSPKKTAITSAIKIAKHPWIITTDADCQLPKFWLDSFDEYIQKHNAVCIAAPVTYTITSTFLSNFQTLDILSLQGATIGGFGLKKRFMCNGANFAYKKATFNAVNGFNGNTKIASGDDIFLLEKIAKAQPNQVHYIKCEKAIVKTHAQPNWTLLIAQRIRWAAKTSAYSNVFGKLTGLVVLLTNALILIGLILAIIGVINFKSLFYMGFIKFNIDFYLLYITASFFRQKAILKSYILGFLVYPLFSVYVACISMFSRYTWKDRQFKK